MRVYANGEGKPGVSSISLQKSEFNMLVDRTAEGDPLAPARAAVTDFQAICTRAVREAILQTKPPEFGGWLHRYIAARQIACCMELCSRLDSETGHVTVSITTQPGCDGSGDTMPYPDRDMIIGCVGLLSQKLCQE